jgi:hypothetical protein
VPSPSAETWRPDPLSSARQYQAFTAAPGAPIVITEASAVLGSSTAAASGNEVLSASSRFSVASSHSSRNASASPSWTAATVTRSTAPIDLPVHAARMAAVGCSPTGVPISRRLSAPAARQARESGSSSCFHPAPAA